MVTHPRVLSEHMQKHSGPRGQHAAGGCAHPAARQSAGRLHIDILLNSCPCAARPELPGPLCCLRLRMSELHMQVMLGLVTDIKNNKRRPGKGAEAAPAVLPAAVQAWLKASGVGDVELRNVTWAKLLRSDKRV